VGGEEGDGMSCEHTTRPRRRVLVEWARLALFALFARLPFIWVLLVLGTTIARAED
jgi:hypothetical protein